MNEQTHTTQENEFINLMLNGGLGDGAPRIMELIMNAAMIVERNAHLNAMPHQRCEERTGSHRVSARAACESATGPSSSA